MSCDASVVLSSLQARATETSDPDALGAVLVDRLLDALPRAVWVGIYWLRGEELVLGPFAGKAPAHTRLPVGQGWSGVAIALNKDQIVNDVREHPEHRACFPTTRSEMIVLIRSMGRVIGEIGIDADVVDAFDPVDHCILRAVSDSFGGLIQFHEEPANDEAHGGGDDDGNAEPA